MGPGRQFFENIAEIREGVDVIQFAGLCRIPNYAERAPFPPDLS